MVFQSLQAHRLRLYGPCRDLTAATELKAGTLSAIALWYPKSAYYNYANPTDGDTFSKGLRQWIFFCQHLCREEPAFACADGSTSYSLISPDSMDRKAEKRARFWEWLGYTAGEGSNEVLNSSTKKMLTPGYIKWCNNFQDKMAKLQFLGCGDAHSQKGVLGKADTDMLRDLRSSLRASLPRKGNNFDRTIGKAISSDEIRACCLMTAVSWLSNGGRRAGRCYFKLLCIKAFSLYGFSNCRRSVLTQNVMMVDLWAKPASSSQLESIDGTCSQQHRVPLMVYAAGSSKDKGSEKSDLPPALDSFIRSQDPMVCLVGTLAEYIHHRHVVLQMPTDSLDSLLQWAAQPILQVQQKDGSLLESTSCPLVTSFFRAAGVQLTPGHITRRLRLGGAQSAQEGGMEASVLKRQMGHSAHEKSYLKQMWKPMKDMAAGAGHSDKRVLLGRSAVSARRIKEFEDLYWSVCPTQQPGFKIQVQAWLRGEPELADLSSALLHIVDCLEDLADVLLQDLAVKQTYGSPGSKYAEAHISQYYTGSCIAQDQLTVFQRGKPSIFESYPFLQPGHRLHNVWQAFSSRVREEEARLHAACRSDTTLGEVRDELASLVKQIKQQPATQPVLQAQGSAQPVPPADAAAMADLQVTLKRGFESVDRGLAAVVEAVQESKRPHTDVIKPYQPNSPPVMKLLMAQVQDSSLLVPLLSEYTVLSVWRVFVEEPIPGVPSPSAYMRSLYERKSWMKLLGKEKLSDRGRAYIRVWANVVRLTRTGLSVEAACAQLQKLCSSSGYHLMRWAVVSADKSGLMPEKDIEQWYMDEHTSITYQ